ncbi:dual specificity phosphatase [Rhexocercosporidium sp. MPI-PUGE-AT-0058]|nr:dual specificity phosphatase [Rhexocercosporidium sp. MPI-PUGE-AT-0058]
MAPLSSLSDANGRTLKRPFTAVTISTPPSPKRSSTSSTIAFQSRKVGQRAEGVSARTSDIGGRRNYFYPIMPSAAGPRMYENHIPSFMSVYDMDATVIESPGLGPLPKLSSSSQHTTKQSFLRPHTEEHQNTQIHSHQHRESTSTQASDSTDSSPTTTISTVDSSSLSDPSPSSSPESPITLVPLSSFSGSSFGLDSFQSLKMDDLSPPQMPIQRPMTSPSPRKTKNLKSLALNLNPSIETLQTSEPSSPSFIKPPTLTGKRKPSLLSLNTGAANGITLSLEPPGSPGIPTMLQRRGLKHSISSPQILSTPSFGPSGGMTLGERKLPLGPSRFKESTLAMKTFTIDEDIHEAPTGVQMATRVPGVAVGGDSFDRPHSGEDAKSPSYPEGPILMYEPSVHLYLEPKVEEAMKFDVIINVAREVKNPFKVAEEKEAAEKSIAKADAPSIEPTMGDTPPDTAMSMLSFQTAFEVQPSGSTESSPTTPKPSVDKTLPEYIHVPWDHNTDVKDELWDLCELIDNRTKEGKKVLVHCQQGASRSATLIIAYHMYKNQSLGPNEAYSQAQSKSRWVNPNMSLLFSLNDFKKVIENKKSENNTTVRKPTVKHRPTLSADAGEAPSTPTRARGNSTPSVSARENALTKPKEHNDSPVATHSAITRLGGFDFGFGNMSINNERPQRVTNEWEDLMSPRLEEMTNNPIQSFTRTFVPEPEPEAVPSLFSPRTFEFPRSSFFPPQRASLAADEDPRSPPTKGEAPITRSIDDFL